MWYDFMHMEAPAAFAFLAIFGSIAAAAIGIASAWTLQKKNELTYKIEDKKITVGEGKTLVATAQRTRRPDEE